MFGDFFSTFFISFVFPCCLTFNDTKVRIKSIKKTQFTIANVDFFTGMKKVNFLPTRIVI